MGVFEYVCLMSLRSERLHARLLCVVLCAARSLLRTNRDPRVRARLICGSGPQGPGGVHNGHNPKEVSAPRTHSTEREAIRKFILGG